MKRAFTLIELLLVTAIVLSVSVLAGPFYARFLGQNATQVTADQIVQSLRKAQFYAMMGRKSGSSGWGVNYAGNTLTVYQGSTYAGRNSALDERFEVSSAAEVWGLGEVNFANRTGLPTVVSTTAPTPSPTPVTGPTATPTLTPTPTLILTSTPTPTPLPPSNFTCTMVIAYSQVGISPLTIAGYGEGWYVAPNLTYNFETIVDNNSWQLLWDSGHGVDQWQNPAATGWTRWANREYPFFSSPCVVNSGTPDRIVLSISGPYGTDLVAWRTNTEAAITTIMQRIPSAVQMVLIPVVGGPAHQTCPCTVAMQSTLQDCSYGPDVRASWQHAYIDTAIGMVLSDIQGGIYTPPGGAQVVAGISPEVRTCDDYYDGIGHLTVDGAQAIGVSIAQYFAGPTPTPTLTPTPGGPTSTPTPTPSLPSVWRINAGGLAYTDSLSNAWSADQAYTVGGFGYEGGGGFSVVDPIANTVDDVLYQTNRNAAIGSFEYRFTVANGAHNVLLKFAEIVSTSVAGSRVFDVTIEGNLVLDNFDIYVASGGTFTAVDRSFSATVNDGVLNIVFSPVVSRPAVNAVEVVSVVASPTPTPTPGGPTSTPTPTPMAPPTPTPTPLPADVILVITVSGRQGTSETILVNSQGVVTR